MTNKIFGREFSDAASAYMYTENLLCESALADIRKVMDKPNASAWERLREHAAVYGVSVFLSMAGQDSIDGTWVEVRCCDLAHALAVRKHLYGGGHAHAVTFTKGGTVLTVKRNGSFDLMGPDVNVHGWTFGDFIDALYDDAVAYDMAN